MKHTFSLLVIAAASLGASAAVPATSEPALKDVFGDKFRVAVAINDAQAKEIDKEGAAIVKHHFNTVVAENVMKCSEIHPEKNRYHWDDADAFVEFAERNGMTVIGHCLIWPRGFFMTTRANM